MPTPPPPPPPPPAPPTDIPGVGPQGTVTSDTPDTPPRRAARAKRETADRPPPPTRTPPLQRRLEEFFVAPAAVYAALGHEYPAQIIAARSPALAEDLYKLSKENPAVARVLNKMMEGGAWGGVIVSFSSILLPLLSYHGVVPIGDPFSGFMGGPTPPTRGPIVPPPPTPGHPSATPGSNGARGDAPSSNGDFSPPVGNGPPGVVTVAGTNASHPGAR